MRLFWSIVGVQVRKRMAYRTDFWINSIVAFAAELGVAYFIVAAMFSGGDRVGEFSRHGMLLYYISVILIGKVVRSTDMEHVIAGDIYDGSLSRYLVYPTSFFFMKYATQIGSLVPSLVQIFLFGAWVPFVLGVPEGLQITPWTVAMCAVALFLGNALHFLVTYPIELVSFWADNCWSLMVLHRIVAGLLGGVLLPLTLFPAWSQKVLAILPFKYMFSFPVDALLGRVTPAAFFQGVGVAIGWCAIMACISAMVWRRGTLQYTGVGM